MVQVAVVVVPTVLGIASIRVYTIKEKPTDGLLPRERVCCPKIWLKSTMTEFAGNEIAQFIFSDSVSFSQLNIYTPLSQSAHAEVVPERPGVIQSGITTARESIQPFVQASKVFAFDYRSIFLQNRKMQNRQTSPPTPTYWQVWMSVRYQRWRCPSEHISVTVPTLISFPVVCGYCAPWCKAAGAENFCSTGCNRKLLLVRYTHGREMWQFDSLTDAWGSLHTYCLQQGGMLVSTIASQQIGCGFHSLSVLSCHASLCVCVSFPPPPGQVKLISLHVASKFLCNDNKSISFWLCLKSVVFLLLCWSFISFSLFLTECLLICENWKR